MKWIVEIKDIQAYKVTCKWNDDKIREIDLTQFVISKAKNHKNSYAQLLDKNRFNEVKCDGTTLYWENGLKYEDYDGTIKNGPLDIAPEVLFELTAEGQLLKSNANY